MDFPGNYVELSKICEYSWNAHPLDIWQWRKRMNVEIISI